MSFIQSNMNILERVKANSDNEARAFSLQLIPQNPVVEIIHLMAVVPVHAEKKFFNNISKTKEPTMVVDLAIDENSVSEFSLNSLQNHYIDSLLGQNSRDLFAESLNIRDYENYSQISLGGLENCSQHPINVSIEQNSGLETRDSSQIINVSSEQNSDFNLENNSSQQINVSTGSSQNSDFNLENNSSHQINVSVEASQNYDLKQATDGESLMEISNDEDNISQNAESCNENLLDQEEPFDPIFLGKVDVYTKQLRDIDEFSMKIEIIDQSLTDLRKQYKNLVAKKNRFERVVNAKKRLVKAQNSIFKIP
jgi:phosphotransferase system HPr-like phosphotransfer protein